MIRVFSWFMDRIFKVKPSDSFSLSTITKTKMISLKPDSQNDTSPTF